MNAEIERKLHILLKKYAFYAGTMRDIENIDFTNTPYVVPNFLANDPFGSALNISFYDRKAWTTGRTGKEFDFNELAISYNKLYSKCKIYAEQHLRSQIMKRHERLIRIRSQCYLDSLLKDEANE